MTPRGAGGDWGPSHGGPQLLPKDFKVDTENTFTGVVTKYDKFKGFGWVKVDQPDVVPGSNLFVFYKSIVSDDRFPMLQKDMQVEFGLYKYKCDGGWSVRAKEVTLPDGEPVNIQDDLDAEQKEFVGGQNIRYSGTLKFYYPRAGGKEKSGFGYVQLDGGFQLSEPVPEELIVEETEVNSGGEKPSSNMKDMRVEFGIWKTMKGKYKVYNMTLPGGVPITKDALENRQIVSERTYAGTVSVNNWQKGFGYIDLAPGTQLPANVDAKMKAMKDAKGQLYFANRDVVDNRWLKKDQKVNFKIYTDDKGVGACLIY